MALEPGGKSACLTFADTDPDAAMRAILKKAFDNSGRNCNAPTRILVARSAHERGIEAARRQAGNRAPGAPDRPGSHIGQVANARHYAHARAMIACGLDSGARLATGGLDAGMVQVNGGDIAPG